MVVSDGLWPMATKLRQPAYNCGSHCKEKDSRLNFMSPADFAEASSSGFVLPSVLGASKACIGYLVQLGSSQRNQERTLRHKCRLCGAPQSLQRCKASISASLLCNHEPGIQFGHSSQARTFFCVGECPEHSCGQALASVLSPDRWVGDCQNYGPLLDPYYNTPPNS